MTATFCDAGQILGSASIRLELREDGQQRRILFSGDLGPSDRPLLNDPAPPDDADIVVMDTTYGDRDHRDLETSIAEFGSALRHTARRGNVELIPASVRVECQCMVGLRSVVMKVSGPGARYPERSAAGPYCSVFAIFR
jgi:Cft2 family RNA processing exonuclease